MRRSIWRSASSASRWPPSAPRPAPDRSGALLGEAAVLRPEPEERVAGLVVAGRHDLTDEDDVIATRVSGGDAAIEEGDRSVEDRRTGLRLMPGSVTEALQLGGAGRLGEAFG